MQQSLGVGNYGEVRLAKKGNQFYACKKIIKE